MALRSLLNRYKSYNRPSLTSGSSSNFSSLAKKQLAAEDAIHDNQYEQGNLSPERYLELLAERSARPSITPLQRVNINEKIGKVKEAVKDAQIDRGYQSGQYTTKQVKDYEKAKLDKMTEIGSEAYIKQAQKVQALTDKAEKEARTAYRITENKRISTLPEDTSANMWQKAQLYEKLAAQARLDGDTQQADVFETQKNNYTSAAKKADVNDLITSTKLSVSQTPNEGLGVPSAEAGANFYSRLLGGSGSNTTGGATAEGGGVNPTPSAVTTGFSGFQSPAIKNAMESLDRQSKIMDRYYQQKQDNASYISAYQKAVNQATGDQKTQLTIQLNNYLQKDKELDNSISNVTQNIQDTVVRIQEAQAKAAAAAFSQEVRVNNAQFQKVENDLETEFAKGKITKEEYIQKGVILAETKMLFSEQVSGIFSQYGNDLSADAYLQKAEEIQKIHEFLTGVSQNLDDYEPVRVDPGGKLTNLLGKGIKPGDVTLTNVRQLKDSGQFDSNYTKVNGVWHQVHYPGEILDSTGLPLSPAFSKEINRNDAFIYNPGAKDGKESVKQVTFLDENNKPIAKILPQTEIDKGIKSNFFKLNPKEGYIQKTYEEYRKPGLEKIKEEMGITPSQIALNTLGKFQQGVQNIGEKILEFGSPMYRKSKGLSNEPISFGDIAKKGGDFVKSAISSFIENKPLVIQDSLAGKAISGIQNLFSKAKEGVQAINPFNPPIVSAASSKSKGVPRSNYSDIIYKVAQKYGIDPKLIYATIMTESGGDPNAERYEPHIDESSYGLGQLLESTARYLGYKGSITGLKDPATNLDLTARYIKEAIAKGARTPEQIATFYNTGSIKGVPTKGHIERFKTNYNQPVTFEEAKKGVVQRITENIPKLEFIKTAQAAEAASSANVVPQSFQPQQPSVIRSRINVATPQINVPQVNPNFTPTYQQATQAAAKPYTPAPIPTFQLPKISIPKISIPQISIPQPVQQVAQKIGSTVQNIASNIGNVLKKFRFW